MVYTNKNFHINIYSRPFLITSPIQYLVSGKRANISVILEMHSKKQVYLKFIPTCQN